MWQPMLPERRRPDLPAAAPARKRQGADARRVAGHALPEPEVRGAAIEQPLGRLTEQTLAGAVHELQPPGAVEGEDGDVDLGHHLAQQRGGFDRAKALFVQGLGENVDLAHHVAEGIVGPAGPGADGEVALAERGEQVGQRLQRNDHAMLDREGAAERHAENQDAQRPLDLWRVVAGPQNDERGEQTGQGAGEGKQEQALIVGEPRRALRRGHSPGA